eukprot:1187611-Prorocentrum_minimum.AAC.1
MDATKIMRANVVKTIGLVLTVFFVTLPAVVLGKDDRWEIAPGVFMPQTVTFACAARHAKDTVKGHIGAKQPFPPYDPLRSGAQVSLGHPDPFGTGNETASALKWFENGGTGIDTAFEYHNQIQVCPILNPPHSRRVLEACRTDSRARIQPATPSVLHNPACAQPMHSFRLLFSSSKP